MSGWKELRARLDRTRRQRRIANALIRVLRLGEVEVLPIGEYGVAFQYVALTNDLREQLRLARLDLETLAPLGHGTPVPEEATLPSGDARVAAL